MKTCEFISADVKDRYVYVGSGSRGDVDIYVGWEDVERDEHNFTISKEEAIKMANRILEHYKEDLI